MISKTSCAAEGQSTVSSKGIVYSRSDTKKLSSIAATKREDGDALAAEAFTEFRKNGERGSQLGSGRVHRSCDT